MMKFPAVPLLLLTAVTSSAPTRADVTRYPNGRLESVRTYRGSEKVGTHRTWWPDGSPQSLAHYAGGVFDGVYETWYEGGAPYTLRNFDKGRESGVQQSWTPEGELYLNYEVRNGRRYGFINAMPCVPTGENGHGIREAVR